MFDQLLRNAFFIFEKTLILWPHPDLAEQQDNSSLHIFISKRAGLG